MNMCWSKALNAWEPKPNKKYVTASFLHPSVQQHHFGMALNHLKVGGPFRVFIMEKLRQNVSDGKTNKIITCSQEVIADADGSPLISKQVFSTILADFGPKDGKWVCRVFGIFNIEFPNQEGKVERKLLVASLCRAVSSGAHVKSFLPLPIYQYYREGNTYRVDVIDESQIIDTVALIPVQSPDRNCLAFGEPEYRADFTRAPHKFKSWMFYCMFPDRFRYPRVDGFDIKEFDLKPHGVAKTFISRKEIEAFEVRMKLTTPRKEDGKLLAVVGVAVDQGVEVDEDIVGEEVEGDEGDEDDDEGDDEGDEDDDEDDDEGDDEEEFDD